MNHKDYAEHTEHYTINDKSYEVTVNMVANILMVKRGHFYLKESLDGYTHFVGDMREYITVLVASDK